MIFALVTTSQLIVVMVGVLTAHLIWNNPPDCPEKYMKYTQLVKVCKLQGLPSGGSQWVLREE